MKVERLCTRCFTEPRAGRRHSKFRQGFVRDSVISPTGTAHQPGRGGKTLCGLDGKGWLWPTYGIDAARAHDDFRNALAAARALAAVSVEQSE